ncbi:uncharacterized protein V1518DRAFT_408758 [Limtongia smithiae]|uniref:uncharacterized protein n=1 Tax=Limtongia smithiae TaxID=1125753 RepID=UPI0034CEA536
MSTLVASAEPVAAAATPVQTTGKKTESANSAETLARIRENQRRSRARKREYVSDLETKIHMCQEEGLQLNVQIQRTARRVVEENRKLRELLAQMGVNEWMVEDWLKSSTELTDENGEFVDRVARRRHEDEVLKAQHPCATCGTAPAKTNKEGGGCQGSATATAPAAARPAVCASTALPKQQRSPPQAQPRAAPVPLARPVVNTYSNTSPIQTTPLAPLPQMASVVYPLSMPTDMPAGTLMQLPNVATDLTMKQPPQQTQTGEEHTFEFAQDKSAVLPIDFTSYFQSIDLSMIPTTGAGLPTLDAADTAAFYELYASTVSPQTVSCCASSTSSASSPDQAALTGQQESGF